MQAIAPLALDVGYPQIRRTALRATLLLGLLLLFDGLYATVGMGLSLKGAGDNLASALRALRRSEVTTAQDDLLAAVGKARSAEAFADHPGLALAAQLPWLQGDVAALRALARAAEGSAVAGLTSLRDVPVRRDGKSDLAASLYHRGRIDFDSVSAMAHSLEETASILTDTRAILDRSARPALGVVSDALGRARGRISSAVAASERAGVALDAVPSLAAEDSQRRYLLAFQSPSEARGGGGLIGVYGVLHATDGKLQLDEVAPIRELVPKLRRPVRGPAWFAHLYGDLLGLEEWRGANLSPSFPTTSKILLRMYRASTGEELDGVIAMDPIVLGQLTRGTGALRGPGWDVAVNRYNARRVLLHDIYEHFHYKEHLQNLYLQGLVERLWNRLERGNVNVAALARGLGDAIARQHLKVFSADASDQDALAQLGADGDLDAAGPNLQMVFNNNFSANKVDYFLRRSLETEIELQPTGDAAVTTTATLVNDAPIDGETNVLVRAREKQLSLGLNRMILSFLLPENARPRSLTIDGRARQFFRGSEDGYPVAWDLVEVPAGDTAKAAVSYHWRDAYDLSDLVFEFTLFPQATVRPDTYAVTIRPPESFHFIPGERGKIARDGRIRFTGSLRAPTRLRVRLSAD